MSQSAQSNSLGEGVYFLRDAYAGMGRRFVIIVIDLAVLIVVGILLIACSSSFPANVESERYFGYLWFAFAYRYLVILEASPIGTLGFLITGVKILNLKGERPSILRMTFRLVLWVLGPFNVLINLIWLGGDYARQTVSDKCAGTIVVRRNSVPTEHGPIHVRYYFLLDLFLAVAEVQKPRLD